MRRRLGHGVGWDMLVLAVVTAAVMVFAADTIVRAVMSQLPL